MYCRYHSPKVKELSEAIFGESHSIKQDSITASILNDYLSIQKITDENSVNKSEFVDFVNTQKDRLLQDFNSFIPSVEVDSRTSASNKTVFDKKSSVLVSFANYSDISNTSMWKDANFNNNQRMKFGAYILDTEDVKLLCQIACKYAPLFGKNQIRDFSQEETQTIINDFYGIKHNSNLKNSELEELMEDDDFLFSSKNTEMSEKLKFALFYFYGIKVNRDNITLTDDNGYVTEICNIWSQKELKNLANRFFSIQKEKDPNMSFLNKENILAFNINRAVFAFSSMIPELNNFSSVEPEDLKRLENDSTGSEAKEDESKKIDFGGTIKKLKTKEGLNGAIAKKDKIKALISNKFIGFGVKNSSTAIYWKQYDKANAANKGKYNENDIIFASMNGMTEEEKYDKQKQKSKLENYAKSIKEVTNALNSGAVIVTDCISYIDGSAYNVGEKALFDVLSKNNDYWYSEVSIPVPNSKSGEKVRLGVWSKEKLSDREDHVLSTFQTDVKKTASLLNIGDCKNFKPTFVSGRVKKADVITPLQQLSMLITTEQMNNRINHIVSTITTNVEVLMKNKAYDLKETQAEDLSQEDRDFMYYYNQGYDGQKNCVKYVIDEAFGLAKENIKEEIERVKLLSDQEVVDEYELDADYVREQTSLIGEWFDVLVQQSTAKLEAKLGVSIEYKESSINVSKSSTDEQKDEDEFGDDEEKEKAIGNEGWGLGAELKDHMKNSKAATRRIINGIKDIQRIEVTKSGRKKYITKKDDLNNTVYLSSEMVYSILVNEMSKTVTKPEDFSVKSEKNGVLTYTFPALKNLTVRYPWVESIIERLKQDPSAISALYHDTCLDFREAWTVFKNEDGKYVAKQVNEPVTVQSLMQSINSAIREGSQMTSKTLWDATGKRIVNGNRNELKKLISEVKDDYYDSEQSLSNMAMILRSIGINIDSESLKALANEQEGEKKMKHVLKNAETIIDKSIDSEEFSISDFKTAYENIAKSIDTVVEVYNRRSYRQNGKDYQSYTTPNFFTFLTRNIKGDNWKDFFKNEYEYDGFLFDKKKGKYRSYLLNELTKDNATGRDARKNFRVKYYNEFDGVPYSDWTNDQMTMMMLIEYFQKDVNGFANFLAPIPAEASSAIFLRLPKITDGYKNKINNHLVDLVKQELYRISNIKKRIANKDHSIQSFEKLHDGEFLFFPELNNYVNPAGKTLLQTLAENKSSILSEDALNNLILSFVEPIMESRFESFKQTVSAEVTESLFGKVSEDMRDSMLEEFFYNTELNQSQIIQLTTTDLAYYKDYVDFQKRFKECYASGSRLNTESKYGRKVQKAIYLKDSKRTSLSLQEDMSNFKRAVADGLITEDEFERIRDASKNINATDAQAYRTLSSYRAVIDMLGDWTPQMEETFNRFWNGTYSDADFRTVFLTLKPFLFSTIKTYDGHGGYMRVPNQNKDSEFLLLAFLNGNTLGTKMRESNKLKGLNRFIEEKNIDVAMFESAVKCGAQNIIDISYSKAKLEGFKKENASRWNSIVLSAKEELSEKDFSKASDYDLFKAGIDYLFENKKINSSQFSSLLEEIEPDEQEVYDMLNAAVYPDDSIVETSKRIKDIYNDDSKNEFQKENEIQEIKGDFERKYPKYDSAMLFDDFDENGMNLNTVHQTDYTQYMIAQESSDHLVDSESVFGSQFRNLIISDLPDDPNFRVTIAGKHYTKQEIIDLYNKVVVENLLEDWQKVTKLLQDNKSLHERVMKLCKGNPSYGPDVINALELIGEPGKEEFNVPTCSPTISSKIEQLVLSIFKNDITKQYAKGAACVLVSSYGFDNKLKVLRGEDGHIEGFQCMLPASAKDMFANFLKPIYDKKNNLIGQEVDIEKIQATCPELLEGISYRIPTEGKYSMAKLIVVGFLPQQNGAVMMLPAETTKLAGEDYDIDKKFMLFKKHYAKYYYSNELAFSDWLDSDGAKWKEVMDDGYMNALKAFYIETLNHTQEEYDDILENPSLYSALEEMFAKEYKSFFKKGYEGMAAFSDQEKTILSEFNNWFNKQKSKKDEYGVPMTKYLKRNSDNEPFVKYIVPKFNSDIPVQYQSRDARNNFIVDMAMAILSNPNMSTIVSKPGNFETLKLEANRMTIAKDQSLTEIWKKDILNNEQADDNELILSLLSAKEEVLKDFLKKNNKIDPLSPNTYMYFHNQNAVGGKLVGIYANNTSAQAKYQESNLNIDDAYTFKINGYEVKSLHERVRPLVVEGKKVSKLISENCAETSAASVDNVKDPVLAKLNQTPNNAYITCAMLRMGLSIQEIGMICSLPFFKENLSEFVKSFEEAKTYHEYQQDINVTSVDLMDCVLHGIKSKSATKVAAMLYRIISVAEQLKTMTNQSRADSPNGAIEHTIAGVIKQINSKKQFIEDQKRLNILENYEECISNDTLSPDMTVDQLREALFDKSLLLMPRLHAFSFFGIESAVRYLHKIFPQLNNENIDFLYKLSKACPFGRLNDKMIRNYLESMVTYALSKSGYFGEDSMDFMKNKAYFCSVFPNEFLKLKSKGKFKKYKIIRALSVDKGDIVFEEGMRLPGLREDFQRELCMMLFSEDEDLSSMAENLFKYSYYRSGLGFRPNGFNFLFDSLFITSIPSYVDDLRDLHFDSTDKDLDWDNFRSQYLINNAGNLFPEAKYITGVPDEIVVKSKYSSFYGSSEPYPYMQANGALYELADDDDLTNDEGDSVNKYVLVGNNNAKLHLYNAFESSRDAFDSFNSGLLEFNRANNIKKEDSLLYDKSTWKSGKSKDDMFDFNPFDSNSDEDEDFDYKSMKETAQKFSDNQNKRKNICYKKFKKQPK